MAFNWTEFALKLPAVVAGTMAIIEKVKSASGAEKKAAVSSAIPESISLAEYVAERNLLNDAVIADLLGAYIDAEKVALRAREALKAGILAKAAQSAPIDD